MAAAGSRYGTGTGTAGGMSELSYSLSDNGTAGQYGASGFSQFNFNNMALSNNVQMTET
jgi:hypothetical protein